MNSSNTSTVWQLLEWAPALNQLVVSKEVRWSTDTSNGRRIGDPRDAPGWPFVHIS